jgi:hypothetical protein
MFISRCLQQLRTVRRLFDQHLSHQIADMNNLRIADLIDRLLRAALGDDDAPIAQHPEVPGNRRLPVAGDSNNFAYPLRSTPQDVDDFDSHGVRQALA